MITNIKKTWVYDLEVLPEIFTAYFIDKDTDDEKAFVISATRNDRKALFSFLHLEVNALIGYNCLHYDSQILEYLFKHPNAEPIELRAYSDLIINDPNHKPDVPEWKLKIEHLDLFRALSLSVKAKRTSLKWCEFMMDLENIEDMPDDKSDNWEEKLLIYNRNDVIATKKLYHKYYHEIELRKALTKSEGVKLINSTEPDMAKKLFLKYLSEATGISKSELQVLRTQRNLMKVKEIIFPYVKFESDIFNTVLKAFNALEMYPGQEFEFNINYQGIEINYGLGGLHAAPKNKLIETTDTHIIRTLDGASYYPHLSFKNGLCPAHLPKKEFLELYESLYQKRKLIPKKDPKNYILKIVINALYGLMNDEYSFVKDPLVGLAICINGQLLLSMLVEKITTAIPDSKVIMINTDGAEFLIPVGYEEIYFDICKWWEELTQIPLEHDVYAKMIIADVNNYISLTVDNKTKCKGKFEFQNIPLHKNKSHSIIPLAVYEYFINNTPIETTIHNHKNIFDFCAGVKSSKSEIKGKSKYVLYQVIKNELNKTNLSKTVRYFISKKGGYLIKEYEDGSTAQVEAPIWKGNKLMKEWKITYFNNSFKLDNFDDYNIDYSYYISKAREWIGAIEQKQQLKLL